MCREKYFVETCIHKNVGFVPCIEMRGGAPGAAFNASVTTCGFTHL